MIAESDKIIFGVVLALPLAIALYGVLWKWGKEIARLLERDWLFHAAFALYLLGTVAFFLWWNLHPDGFMDGYYDRAVNLLDYGVYSQGKTPTAFFPPGYSLVLYLGLLALGKGAASVFLVNIIAFGITIYLVRAALHSANSKYYNSISLVVLLSLGRFWYHFTPVSDGFASYVLVGALCLLVLFLTGSHNGLLLVYSGFLMGFAVLVRANTVLFIVPLVSLILLTSTSFKLPRPVLAGVFILAALAPIAIWTGRNARVFSEPFFISTNGGYNLFMGNNPQANGIFDMYDRQYEQQLSSLDEVEKDRFLAARALEWITGHPAAFVTLSVKKLVRAFSSDTGGVSLLSEQVLHIPITPIPEPFLSLSYTFANISYYCVLLFFLRHCLALARNWRVAWRELMVIVLLTCAVAAPIAVVFAYSRLRDFYFYVALLGAGGLLTNVFARRGVSLGGKLG
jgi:4-amino-4-deoxy-L-arabinose transferase-like glycosyltransferase